VGSAFCSRCSNSSDMTSSLSCPTEQVNRYDLGTRPRVAAVGSRVAAGSSREAVRGPAGTVALSHDK
jgi:hypothetical protein